MRRRSVWGLTGGIGSGKSTVARCLAQHGLTVVDADEAARALTLKGGLAIDPIRSSFGDSAIGAEGAMDRAYMREKIFTDASAKQQLEAIIHPLVQVQMAKAIDDAPTDIVVCDVPLLAESVYWRARCERIWVVDCLPSTQVARVKARNGLSTAQVETIMAQQASRAARLAIADTVLYNDQITIAELSTQVDDHLHQLDI
jgi:dephospho-CoA kinase